MPTRADILITGANGFIGRGLIPVLLGRGKRLRGLYRRPEPAAPAGVETAIGDLLHQETLGPALEGIDCAIYLVHSLAAGRDRFHELDRQAAENFVAAAEQAGVRRVIYLSGLGERSGPLSEHLASRCDVEAILAAGRFQTTTLRAAIILGAGGASFELLRYLVNTQPLLLDSAVLDTPCQPIALADMLHYLAGCIDEPRTAGGSFDICGPEVLSYRDLLERFARISGSVNLFVPVPRIPPALVGLWVGLFSRQDRAVVEALLEGLGNPVVCRERRIQELLPCKLMPLDKAITLALQPSGASRGNEGHF
ncbi:MAG: NAD(P)H-binding protein [Desulfuromonadales bacterium]|nr:NAD(P)H-binding protein [Desulfuromonadales bacterium]